MTDRIARAEIEIEASAEKVWDTITTHASDVNFGAAVESDWTVGSPITWRGEWNDTAFEDRGEILEAEAPRRLIVTHRSASAAAQDAPNSPHVLTYELRQSDGVTHLDFSQTGNASESAQTESEKNWRQHLAAVKERAEADS